MGEDHDPVIAQSRQLLQLCHSRNPLLDAGDLFGQGNLAIFRELLTLMIVPVEADGKPIPMRLKELHYFRFASIEVPGNKCNCGMEVVLVHFGEDSLIAKTAEWFRELRVIDRKIGETSDGMPAAFPGGMTHKHHDGRGWRKYAGHPHGR